ncbi:MAG: tyrosine-type recombinase/integrase [Campylobacterota bacterium]|nr:tyrosine-type recombinase/integrase [Campylobacterota bacterium]
MNNKDKNKFNNAIVNLTNEREEIQKEIIKLKSYNTKMESFHKSKFGNIENFKIPIEMKEKIFELKEKERRLINNEIRNLKKVDINEDNIEDRLKQLEDNILQKITNTPSQSLNQSNKINNLIKNIDNYYTEYIEHRKTFDKISQSSIKGYNASFRYLKYFINNETEFTFKFFKDIQKKFTQLPKNFFKYSKYHTKTFEELLEIKQKENYETLNNKTINNHINSYKMLFAYLKYEEYIEINPLSDIQLLPEEKFTNKEEFTEEELKTIFKSDMDKEYINMCKISLYTGLRIEEVLSIKKENIKDNLIHIDLNDTSSKKHQRIIPIHQNIKECLNNQIKENKGAFLFFGGNIGNGVKNVGKRVNRRLNTIIPIKEKTFHSFRKNFSQEIELKTTAEERTKKYLMGHSQSKDITHTIYNRGKINIEKLKDCINQITYIY